MKASRADGCVKIKVVGVSGRTHGRKASIDNEKKSVERKEKESTCVMETEGYSDISVMEKQGGSEAHNGKHKCDRKGRESEGCNGKPDCDGKGRTSGHSNGKP